MDFVGLCNTDIRKQGTARREIAAGHSFLSLPDKFAKNKKKGMKIAYLLDLYGFQSDE